MTISFPFHLALANQARSMQCHRFAFVLSNAFVFKRNTFTGCFQLLNYHYLLTVNFVEYFTFFLVLVANFCFAQFSLVFVTLHDMQWRFLLHCRKSVALIPFAFKWFLVFSSILAFLRFLCSWYFQPWKFIFLMKMHKSKIWGFYSHTN